MRYHLDVLLERPLLQRVLVLAALMLALAALDHALVYRPEAGRIAQASADLELARLREARLRAVVERGPQLRGEAAALQRALPARPSRRGAAPTPLESASARSAAAGLEMIRFQPGAAPEQERQAGTPMAVELKGTFHDLLGFFELPEESRGFPSAANLKVDALPPEHGRIVLRIALEMAVLAAPPERPAAAAAGSRVPEPAAHGPGTGPGPALARTRRPPPPRDPFRPYEPAAPPAPAAPPEPGTTPEPAPAPQFRAVAIVWERRSAVALVRDAEGLGHVVRPGTKLGRGHRVKAITPCQVILETTRDGAGRREVRLSLPRCRGSPFSGPL